MRAGAYSFANVPVGQYQIVNGAAVFSGTYTLTASLVSYNAGQTDPNKKYRDYYYNNVLITFTSLAPGDSLAVSDMVGSAFSRFPTSIQRSLGRLSTRINSRLPTRQ